MSNETKIMLVLTYSQPFSNIGNIVGKHLNILSINKSFTESFKNEPIMSFICNRNLKELIGCNKIKHTNVKKSIPVR